MLSIFRYLAIATLIVGSLETRAQSAKDELTAIDRHFQHYTALMNSVDTDVIATKIYSTPIFFLAPDGRHSVISSPEHLSRSLHDLLAYRKKNPSLPKATSEVRSVCLLSTDVAVASVHFEFPMPDSTTTKVDWFYMLQKSKGDWRTTMLTRERDGLRISCGGS